MPLADGCPLNAICEVFLPIVVKSGASPGVGGPFQK